MNDTLKSALSSEYVLGTLQLRTRQRFQRILMQDEAARQSLWFWERHLNEIGTTLAEQKPSDQVWINIQRSLGFISLDSSASQELASDNVVDIESRRAKGKGDEEGVISPPERSQWMSNMAVAAVLMLATAIIWSSLRTPVPIDEPFAEQVAIVQGAQSQALWLIKLHDESIEVQATAKLQQYTDKDYELWLVAADGRAPVSLGLLPKQGRLDLARIDLFDQVQVAALAVSLEPLGGSPTGQPTTVLYTTELLTI